MNDGHDDLAWVDDFPSDEGTRKGNGSRPPRVPRTVSEEQAKAAVARRAYRLIRASEVMTPTPIDWLVNKRIEVGSVNQIFGDPKCGKSLLAIHLAACASTGSPWLGLNVKQACIAYLAGEGFAGIGRRLRALEMGQGLSVRDAPFYVSERSAPLTDPQGVAEVRAAIEALPEPPGLIVVDTLARHMGGMDENSTQHAGAFLDGIEAIRGDSTVIVVHHKPHGLQQRGRGASAFRGAWDASFMVSKDSKTGLVLFELVEGKELGGVPPQVFALRAVELPETDDQGQHETSVILEPVEADDADVEEIRRAAAPAAKPRTGNGTNQKTALKVLKKLYDRQRANLSESGHNPDGARVEIADWKTACVEGGVPGKRFFEVSRSLQDNGAITLDGRFVHVR